MNILITGCAGFIGSWVTQKLLSNSSHKVYGVDNFDEYYSKEMKMNNMKDFFENKNFIFFENDITNQEFMSNLFKANSIDAVIHLAAKAGVRNSVLYPLEYNKTNVEGTLCILDCMKKYNTKKIIFASSSSVYGNVDTEKFSEDMDNLKPLSVYAQSKKIAEEYIELYCRQYGLNAVCLRFFTVYGKRQRPDLAISKFTRLIKNNEAIPMYGDGSTYRDYTHVEDISDGIIAAITYDKTPFEIINLGSENPVRLIDLINTIENITGKKASINIMPVPQEDMRRTYADITKAKCLLGYSPKILFKDGLTDFINSFDKK